MTAIQHRPNTQLSRRGFISTLGKVALAASSVALGVTAEAAAAVEQAVAPTPRWAADADDKAQIPLILALGGMLAGAWARSVKTTAEDTKAMVDDLIKNGTY